MRIIPLQIIILAFFLFCAQLIFGQEKNIAHDNEQDKKYIPNPSSIFNTLNKNEKENNSGDITIKNVIKFCPTMLFRQKVMFFYERDIGQGFVLNLGIGRAFGDDFLQRTFLEIKSSISDQNTLPAYDILSNSSYYKSSPYIYIGARYYFSGQSFDGSFIDAAYRYENMEYLLNPTINGNGVDASNNADFKMNAFSFGYGYTVLTGHKNNISHEFYINFGIKFFRYTQFDLVQYQTPYGGIVPLYVRSNLEQKIRILPALNIGYCFGFGF